MLNLDVDLGKDLVSGEIPHFDNETALKKHGSCATAVLPPKRTELRRLRMVHENSTFHILAKRFWQSTMVTGSSRQHVYPFSALNPGKPQEPLS